VLDVLIVGIAATGATAAQAVSGFGLSLVLAPVVQAVSPGAGAVRLVNLVTAAANAVLLAISRRHVQWRTAVLIGVPSVATAVVLAPVLASGGTRTVSIVAGSATLLAVALTLHPRSLQALRGIGGALAAGATSGALTVSSGAGGAPVAAHMATQNWSARQVVATAQLVFLPVNIAAVFALNAPIEHALLLAAAAGEVLGVGLGRQLRSRLSAPVVRKAVLVIATVGSTIVIAKAL
jgi:uncharacterized membrane protein YfcA